MPADILIIDDSKIMREMIKRTISMSGLDVDRIFEASNGIEGFASLAQHDVAVVLLDINMPVMNGLQFLDRVVDDKRLRGVPIVIASTEGSETRINDMLARGAKGYVRKPFQPEQIRDALSPFVPLKEVDNSATVVDSDDDTAF